MQMPAKPAPKSDGVIKKRGLPEQTPFRVLWPCERPENISSVGRSSFGRSGIRGSGGLLVVLVLVVVLLAVMLLRARLRGSIGLGGRCSFGSRSRGSFSGRRSGSSSRGGIGERRSSRQGQGGNGSDQGEVEKTHLETELHNRIKTSQRSVSPKWPWLQHYHSCLAGSRINFMKFQSRIRAIHKDASIQTNSIMRP